MEPFPIFRSNKRYEWKTGPLSYGTPVTVDDALDREHSSLQTTPPSSSPPKVKRETPPPYSHSSNWWSEIRKSPTPKQVPRSRKTTEATIKTEATMTQPAFESDAFAVHMPTTREPILDTRVVMPSQAQIDAYQTYKRKGQEMREKQRQDGVRVPSKIVSYDYACANVSQHNIRVDFDLPNTPAGAFPETPPQPQSGWANPAHRMALPRSNSEGVRQIPRKPSAQENARSNSSRSKFSQRADSGAGAAVPAKPTKPPTIKVRIKPKAQSSEKAQKETWFGLYNRSPQSTTAGGSRSPSPPKESFTYVRPSDRALDSTGNDGAGTVAGASKTSPAKPPKDKEKSSSTSRWAWLRSSPSTKLVKSAISAPKISSPVVIEQKTYIDPFVLHALPTTPEPVVARKISRPQESPAVAEKGKFESGWEQIQSLTAMLLKVVLVLYVLVGLYFLLDAIRVAVHAIGAPFRALRAVSRCFWVVLVCIGKLLGVPWQK